MQLGNMRVRPVGGAPGFIAMIAFSIAATVVLTVLFNVWVTR